ncbi:MAG: hypothetical protein JJT88_08410 [Gammaproteobacteria bacterium]|nr:hypothetical protein [Gammaproteobacteria bacterium]
MNRLAVLSNPRSKPGHARERLIANLAGLNGVDHQRCGNLSDLPAQLADILATGPQVLAVNGGDGTLQAVLTALLGGGFDDLPVLCALPGGSTNMSAGDLGAGGSLRRALPALLTLRDQPLAQWPVATRPVLEVRSDDGAFHAGLFFGVGTIVRGAEFWHSELRGAGRTGELAAGAALARGAWGMLRRQPPFADPTRLQLQLDDAEPMDAEVSLLLVTVMKRLFLGLTPFWGSGDAPLACTWIDDRPQRLLRRLPALLRGQAAHMHAGEGYHSQRAEQIRIAVNDVWLLDGELHPGGAALSFQPSRPLTFVDLRRVRS